MSLRRSRDRCEIPDRTEIIEREWQEYMRRKTAEKTKKICNDCAMPCKSTGAPMTACYKFTTLKPLRLSEDDRRLILDALWVARRMVCGLSFPHSAEGVDRVISHISN